MANMRIVELIVLTAVTGIHLAYCRSTKLPPDQTITETRPPEGKTAPPPTEKTVGQTETPPTLKTRPASDPTPTPSKNDKVTTGLSNEEQEKVKGAFDTASTINFDVQNMFEDGHISGLFETILEKNELDALNQIKLKYGNVMDIHALFGEKGRPEDVIAFLNIFSQSELSGIDKLLDSPETLTTGDRLSYAILAAIDKTVLRTKLDLAPESVTDKICEELNKEYTNRHNMKHIIKAVDCIASLAKFGKKPKGDLAGTIARNEIHKKRILDWDAQDWEKSIVGGYFTKLPDEAARLIPAVVVENKLGELNTLIKDKKMRKIVSRKIAEIRGSNPIRATDLGNMGTMAMEISAKEFGSMDSAEMMSSIATLNGIAKNMNRAQRAQVKKHLKGGSITKDNITDAIGLMDRRSFDQISSSEVVGAVADLGQDDLDEETARLVARKLKSSVEYDEPSDWTNDKIKQSGSITKGLPAKMLKEATNVDFESLLTDGTVADMDLPKDSARVVVERIFTDSGKTKMVQSDIENLGDNIKGLRRDRVEDIDPDDLLNAMDNMKDTISKISSEMDKSAKSAMIDKIGSATGGLAANAEKLGCLLKDVPVARLNNENDADFGDMSGQTTRDFNCSEEQSCAVLYEVVKNTIGEPGLNNSLNYTKLAFLNLGKVMCGMTVDDLKKLPPTSDLVDIVEILLDKCDLSSKKKAVLKVKMEYRFGLLSGEKQTVSEEDIEKVAKLLMHFDASQLVELGTDLCSIIVEKMGTESTNELTDKKIKQLSSYALKCVEGETGTLDGNVLDALGTLVAGLDLARVKDVFADALPDIVSELETSAINADTRKAWMVEVVKVLGGMSIDNGGIIASTLGPLVVELSDSDRLIVSDEDWSMIGFGLIEANKKLQNELNARENNGVGVNDKDRKMREEKEDKINEDIKDAYKNTASSSIRRKRSVTSLSCTDMQSLGSGVTSMTTSELEAMTDSDFLDCASFLGETSTWSSDQLSSLLTVASRSGTFGDSISWTADNVYEAGIIVQALSSSEITALTGLDLDAMSSMGQHEGWGETQLSSGFSRWLSLNKGDDVSTVTSTELIGLGHFACGASTSHISTIPSAEYSYAASYIGSLTSCSDSQLVAYADLAETAFGPISSWDTSIISTLGSVIGGLTANELGSLSTSQVAAITPSSIAQIPSSVFVGFTVDQLSGFSVAQAQATTSSQQAGLSQAQLNALIAAGATIDDSSSMPTIHISITTMFASTVLAVVFKTI